MVINLVLLAVVLWVGLVDVVLAGVVVGRAWNNRLNRVAARRAEVLVRRGY